MLEMEKCVNMSKVQPNVVEEKNYTFNETLNVDE